MNSNSTNFNNNINRISNLPKSLTTTIPTFEGKSEKLELFEDLFQTSLEIHNQLTGDQINYFHSPLSHAWWCATNIQKHHQPQKREFGRNLECVLYKIRETSVNGYSKTQISTTGVQSSEPQVNWFSRRTPENSEICLRSFRSGNHWAVHICQNATPREEII